MALESEPFIGLTAAGTAPVLHRIPFSSPIPGQEQAIPKNRAKVGNPTNLFYFFCSFIPKQITLFMNQREAENRISFLREELDKQNYNYYVLNNPQIDDYTFDQMMAELIGLETAFPEFFDATSPSQRVGNDHNQEFKQITHKYQMLSLSNTYSEEEVREFDQRGQEAYR